MDPAQVPPVLWRLIRITPPTHEQDESIFQAVVANVLREELVLHESILC